MKLFDDCVLSNFFKYNVESVRKSILHKQKKSKITFMSLPN